MGVGSSLPAVVVVPAHPHPSPDSRDVQLELTALDGGVAVVAFSTVALLLDRLGSYQPWLMMSARRLCALMAVSALHAVVLDPPPDCCRPVWTRQALDDLEEVQRGRVH